jgi:thiamine pyrophosphate-dependent acetolactate synthase large subunit-like protein
MALMTGGGALVAALAAHGVDTVFGIPGTHNLAIYAELPRHGIRHVSPRHEQGAGYAADGYARVTGRPGVCLTTTGPAVLNAATAAAQSYSDSVPVLLISPGMPLNHPGRGNGLLHELKDQRAALDALLAYSHRVTSVSEIPLAVAQAFVTMRDGRPRPVHLEVPLDLLEQEAEVDLVDPLPVAVRAPALGPVNEAAERLAGAQRPLLLVGGGARAAARQVRDLAERLGAPVVTTANGKGVMPADHPLSIGAGLHHPSVAALAADSDVVVAVGTELSPADLWNGPLPVNGTLVRIDIDGTAVATNARPDVAVVGDADLALRALLDRVAPAPDGVGGEARAGHWRRAFRADAEAEGGPWLMLVEAIAQCLGRDGVLAGDSTMACYYGALSNLPAYRPGRFLYPAGLGTLGYGLPAAIGAKVARPDARVMALHGDGGVMFTIAELASAAELGLALPVVVVDNGGYGEIRNEMVERQDPVHAVGLGRPDFPALARAMGCHGLSVTDPAALPAALERAFAADRPTLLLVHEHSPYDPTAHS